MGQEGVGLAVTAAALGRFGANPRTLRSGRRGDPDASRQLRSRGLVSFPFAGRDGPRPAEHRDRADERILTLLQVFRD